MNALLGVVKLGELGVDILHLNLHKTFSTPHGGGGPGAGPIAVQGHLAPFLPTPRVVKNETYTLRDDFPDSIGRLLPFTGHFGILVRAFSYILSLGSDLPKVTEYAVLNATYLKERLRHTLPLAYDQPCLHECVFSDRQLRQFGVSSLDLAKRLIDYGFHPPTIYFPLVVPGAIMIEPTETESKEEIDQFIVAVEKIVQEAETEPELLHAAPHHTKVRRLDETAAARKPCLCG
jgi:glycine dehydrogenase subunit 2